MPVPKKLLAVSLFIIWLLAPAPLLHAEISVSTPADSTTVELAAPSLITWHGVPSGTIVRIELYRNSTLHSTLALNQPGGGDAGGSFSWRPAHTLAPGSGYQIRLLRLDQPAEDAFSEEFTLVIGPMRIVSPNGGETYRRDTTMSIVWLSNVGGNVKIELLHRSTGSISVLAANTPNSGSFNWGLGDWVNPKGAYTIRVTSLANPAATDTSDGEFCFSTFAYDQAVHPKAQHVLSPAPAITITWPPWSASTFTHWEVYRRSPEPLNYASWGAPLATLPLSAESWTDTSVIPGVLYEYKVVRRAPSASSAEGLVYAGIDLPLIEDRGTVVLIVDHLYAEPLAAELARYAQDLVGDGWAVVRHDVTADDRPQDVKALIRAEYASAPDRVKAVILFGRVAIPLTGYSSPDGHAARPMSSDGYYGDMTMPDQWTDTKATGTFIPSDGIFDPNSFPRPVDLAVGRIDLVGMTAFALDHVELHRRYLKKVHDYRHKRLTAANRALVDDGFSPSTYAKHGWRNWGTLADTIQVGDWNTVLPTNDFLFGYGCGGGTPTSAAGVVTTPDFATKDHKVIFTMLFGSYFWEFQYDNSLLRAPLATSYGLTCVWAGFQGWPFHPLAMGATIGECHYLAVNATLSMPAHMSLMGDPTLRLHVVAPPSNLVRNGNALTWTASPDTAVSGYHVYRAPKETGSFVRLTASPVSGTSYSDPAGSTSHTYMVRAIKREVSSTGSYFNASQGTFSTKEYLTVSPGEGAQSRISFGATQRFSATVHDSDLAPLSPQPLVTWSVDGGGSITHDGTFTAGQFPGDYTVTATAGDLVQTTWIIVVPYPDAFVFDTETFDYSGWSSGEKPMNATWKFVNGSASPTVVAAEDAYVQLNNIVLSKPLPISLSGDFDLSVDALHTIYGRFLWFGIFNQAGTEGYGFSWDSSLSTLQNGCGVVALRKYNIAGPSSLTFNTAGTLLGKVANSGHVVTTTPFARFRLTWSRATGRLDLYVDDRLLASVVGETGPSEFSRLCFGGGSGTRFGGIRISMPHDLRAWRLANELPHDGTGIGASSADPDADGLPNLLEYAIGQSPIAPDSAGTITQGQTIGSERLTLTFPRVADADITYQVEATGDLASGEWNTIFTSTGAANIPGFVTVEDPELIADHPLRFLRLAVSTSTETVEDAPKGFMSYAADAHTTVSVGVPLLRPSVLGSLVTLGDADSITLRQAVGQTLNLADLLEDGVPYYIEVEGHASDPFAALIGERFEINVTATRNLATNVVKLDIASPRSTSASADFAELIGYRIRIRPHWTLGGLLGQGISAGLNAAASASAADQVQTLENGLINTYYFRNTSPPQWRKTGITNHDRTPIPPGEGFMFTRRDGEWRRDVFGEVRTSRFIQPLKTGGQFIAQAYPIDQSPASLGLTIANGFTAAVNAASADQILVWSDTLFSTYYLKTGNPPQWRRAGPIDYTNDYLLRAAECVFLKVKDPSVEIIHIPSF